MKRIAAQPTHLTLSAATTSSLNFPRNCSRVQDRSVEHCAYNRRLHNTSALPPTVTEVAGSDLESGQVCVRRCRRLAHQSSFKCRQAMRAPSLRKVLLVPRSSNNAAAMQRTTAPEICARASPLSRDVACNPATPKHRDAPGACGSMGVAPGSVGEPVVRLRAWELLVRYRGRSGYN